MVTPAFFPHMVDFTGKLTLTQTRAMNIHVVFPSSLIKILVKSVKGLISYDWTYKQTNENFIYI